MLSGVGGIVPDAFIPLAGALVAEATPQQTKRPNPIVITSTSHQHMQQHILQHDEPGIIKHWFDNIRKAINKLVSIIQTKLEITLQIQLLNYFF